MILGERLFREEWIDSNTLFKHFKKELLNDYQWFEWRIHYEVRRDINERLYRMQFARSFESIPMNFKWGWG